MQFFPANPVTTTREMTEARTSQSLTSISHTTDASTAMPPTTAIPDTTMADELTTLEETTEPVTSPTIIAGTSPATATGAPTVTQGVGVGIPMTGI